MLRSYRRVYQVYRVFNGYFRHSLLQGLYSCPVFSGTCFRDKKSWTVVCEERRYQALLFFGVMIALNFVFFIVAFSYTSIAEVCLACSVIPVFVYFIASKTLKKKITFSCTMAFFAVVLGLYLMNSSGFEDVHLLGNIFVGSSSGCSRYRLCISLLCQGSGES